MKWTVETYGPAVDAEIAALPADMQDRLDQFRVIVQEQGLQALPSKAVKHLEDKLWELRITSRDGISRVIYVTVTGRRMVLLRAFVKKSQKTPAAELSLARKRLANIGQGHSATSSRNG
jgi:phage-related protein